MSVHEGAIAGAAGGARERPGGAEYRRRLALGRSGIYALVVGASAIGLEYTLPGALPRTDATYSIVAAGVAAGALLGVRLRPGVASASVVLVPLLVAFVRYGSGALPAVVIATLLANVVRRSGPIPTLAALAHDVLAFGAGAIVASLATGGDLVQRSVAFAVVFSLLRSGLWTLSQRLRVDPATNPRAERPSLILAIVLAPLAALPILAGDRLGDGALLLSLTALMALLFVVREATNLATARLETEAERNRLARTNELQDELIHLITHELKNPLTMVLAYAQLAQKAVLDGNASRLPTHIETIERGGKAIERLVDNLLSLSELEQSGELPASEPVHLSDLADEVLSVLDPIAEQKGLELAVEMPFDLPAASAPRLLLHEALSNLVSNAIKYTPKGGRVTVWAATGQPGTLILGVTDTGIGLSEQDQRRLFDKFFRSADPRARQERGTGLGLALTQAIVLRMGGRIEVESKLDEGTTFRLVLPAAPAA